MQFCKNKTFLIEFFFFHRNLLLYLILCIIHSIFLRIKIYILFGSFRWIDLRRKKPKCLYYVSDITFRLGVMIQVSPLTSQITLLKIKCVVIL